MNGVIFLPNPPRTMLFNLKVLDGDLVITPGGNLQAGGAAEYFHGLLGTLLEFHFNNEMTVLSMIIETASLSLKTEPSLCLFCKNWENILEGDLAFLIICFVEHFDAHALGV